MEWVHGVFVGGGTIIFVLFLGIISYLSSKRYDMSHYSQRVSYCCAFPDYLSPGWINMTNMSYDFNKVLDKPYLIRAENTSEFIEYYRTYREWLLCKYFDRNVRFFNLFPNYLSWKKRKYYDRDSFEKLFGAMAKEQLFFAQSFYMFSKNNFEHRSKYDISPVECQMRLGSIYMMRLIDNKNYIYDYEITDVINLYEETMKEYATSRPGS